MSGSMTNSKYPARERSRTDPGHVSKIPSLSPHVQTTPRIPPVSTGSMPGRAPRGIPLNHGYASVSNSSGSELNLHGERGRALFVTNAVIAPSSSSSSEDVEVSHPTPIRNFPAWSSSGVRQESYPYDSRPAPQGVGLGLGMAKRTRDTHSRVRPLAESGRNEAESEYHSDHLGDEDEDHLAVSSSASSAYLRSLIQNRQSLHRPDLTRNVSTTSGDSLPNPWDLVSGGSGPNESDQRRRELIELVKGMDKGSSQPYEFDSMSEDEYVGEHGVAISPSDDFVHNANTTLRPEDEDGGHLRRRSAIAGPSQSTPRQLRTPDAFSGELTEYSPSRKLPGTYGRTGNQSASVLRNDQETEFSPLSQYSGDEDGPCGPDNTRNSSSLTRKHRSPITQDGSLLRSIREGDRSSSSRESPGRTPGTSVSPLTTMHRASFSTEGSSQRAHRASRDGAAASPRTGLPGALLPGRIQNFSRIRERKVTKQPPTRAQDATLSHSDSSSSIESLRWRNEEQDISVGAEAIFGQFGTESQSTTNGSLPVLSQRQDRAQKVALNRSSKPPSPRAIPNPPPARLETDPYEGRGVRNVHEGENIMPLPHCDERNPPTPEHERRTWLSTISSSAYHSLLDRYGEVEIKRQQIIWDLCETERAFVRRLRTFVRLFIRPLRVKDSVTWLAGVPPEVARLFDWLEDLINIHAQISSALRAIVSEQYPIVMRVAGRIRSFVSRLEVHQSYVVRLESTTLLIKRLAGESSSDFGEFIRIQQEQDECHGWNVEAFLVEPVNRLVDYPIHFKVSHRLLVLLLQAHPSPSGYWT